MSDNPKRDVLISKKLSYILRHGAKKENISIDNQGFVSISDILNHQLFKSFKTTREDLNRIVLADAKNRYTIDFGADKICANQGHSLTNVNNENLIKLSKDELINLNIYHGTYFKKLPLIKKSGGLNKRNRNHIHFTCDSLNGQEYIRKNANVLVYVDIEKCIEQGLEFYKSSNNVILTSGDSLGNIKWENISKIISLKDNNELNLDDI
ncbi:TPT1 [Candida pseudojiufengensis]|uniref:TPT1 n=1 Tax=Candida pseudojiufengensis TaxID=497109 RepID=UPI002224E43F|nr:TPT1 [Candida pseudojiufengensis]KAI5959070.1 TPT1 [Candida pseudojiufengensis]